MSEGMDEELNWKSQLLLGSRLRILLKLVDHIKKHHPFSGPEGLLSLTKMAVSFEDEIYTAAVTQIDYLCKISLKMVIVENWPLINRNLLPINLPTNPVVVQVDDATWKKNYQVNSRLRIVNKLLETLMAHTTLFTPEDFLEATEFAVRFEKESYAAASSETEYLHMITMELLSMEMNGNGIDY